MSNETYYRRLSQGQNASVQYLSPETKKALRVYAAMNDIKMCDVLHNLLSIHMEESK